MYLHIHFFSYVFPNSQYLQRNKSWILQCRVGACDFYCKILGQLRAHKNLHVSIYINFSVKFYWHRISYEVIVLYLYAYCFRCNDFSNNEYLQSDTNLLQIECTNVNKVSIKINKDLVLQRSVATNPRRFQRDKRADKEIPIDWKWAHRCVNLVNLFIDLHLEVVTFISQNILDYILSPKKLKRCSCQTGWKISTYFINFVWANWWRWHMDAYNRVVHSDVSH